jgi:hypothetical protein
VGQPLVSSKDAIVCMIVMYDHSMGPRVGLESMLGSQSLFGACAVLMIDKAKPAMVINKHSGHAVSMRGQESLHLPDETRGRGL